MLILALAILLTASIVYMIVSFSGTETSPDITVENLEL